MTDQKLRLPVGYWRDKVFHKSFSLSPITGFMEDGMGDNSKSPVSQVTELLAGCVRRIGPVKKVTPKIIRELSISDRNYILLKLRESTFGPRIVGVLTCPDNSCSKKMDIDFNIDDLTIEERELTSPDLVVKCGRTAIKFRLPNSGDQEAAAQLAAKNPDLAETEILGRCIRSINGKHPSKKRIKNLTVKQKDAILKRMAELDPLSVLEMQLKCPECGKEFQLPFDIETFFSKELNEGIDQLYREVHLLAYHYHWTENKILSLPRWKRKKYIEHLTDELAGKEE